MLQRILISKNLRVLLIAICGNLISISTGAFVGWTSPILPKLRENTYDSPLNYGISIAEEGWISSSSSIGAIFASFLAGPLAGRIGRKWSLLLSSVFMALGFILMIFAPYIWIIYLARFLQGVGGAIGGCVLPMYIGEIATDDIRGAAGSLMTIFVSMGVLYVYVIGPYVSYMVLQLCCVAFQILFFVAFFFMPESPYYFALKGQKDKGIKSLEYLRGEGAEQIENEMEEIQNTVQDSMENKGTLSDIIYIRGYRKATIICTGLLFFQQSTGTSAVTFNSQSIFSSAESSVDPAIATIIIGGVQLATNMVTPFVIERMGRKVILMISSFGMGVALFVLGTFFYIHTYGDPSGILWMPVPALIIFNAFYGFGIGPVPWAVLGEIFPSNIKSVASSIACPATWVTSFLVTRFFPELNALGAFYAFWMFGFLCVLAFFFVVFVVIETKGLSLQQIQDKLHAR